MLDVKKKNESDETAPRHKVTWDWTVNVPTILTLGTLLFSCVGFGISTYYQVEKRVTASESTDVVLRRDVDRIDAETKALRAEQSSKIDALRGELRGELRDVNGKLDQLLLRRGRDG
jgi:hypothetical protein